MSKIQNSTCLISILDILFPLKVIIEHKDSAPYLHVFHFFHDLYSSHTKLSDVHIIIMPPPVTRTTPRKANVHLKVLKIGLSWSGAEAGKVRTDIASSISIEPGC